jgi:hypothetical protein
MEDNYSFWVEKLLFLLRSPLFNFISKSAILSSMVVHAYDPGTLEAEAGGSKVPSQPGLQNETLYPKKKKN